jgi:hypothetical protein
MYCPRCGSTQSEEINYCKSCGANLFAVRRAVDTREVEEEKKFDWADTWVADMFRSPDAQARRKAEIELQLGITPEAKRYNEIKAGVIVSSVGAAVMIFLWVFMQGIIDSGKVTPADASILNHVWIAGIIPFFVGLALMFNGTVISKRLIDLQKKNYKEPGSLPERETHAALRSGDASQFAPTDFSVTEHTTRHLGAEREK